MLLTSRALAQYDPHPNHAFGSQSSNLTRPEIALSATTAIPGQILTLTNFALSYDTDFCTTPMCPVWGGEFYDTVTVAYSATGGELGHLDGFGQFQASTTNPTHFRCGPPGAGQVQARPEDAAQVYDPATGQLMPGFDDEYHLAQMGIANVTIALHEHEWTSTDDIPQPALSAPEEVIVGERVPVSASTPQDWDYCEASTQCGFSGNMATNSTFVSAWLGGGTFGYFDANGQWTPTTNPVLVTHWEAPATPGDVTLRVEVDDIPSATDGQGQTSATRDDAPSFSTKLVTVRNPAAPHSHTFGDPNDPPLQQPQVSFAVETARPDRVVGLSISYWDQDADLCKNEDSNCPWYGGWIYDLATASYAATGGELGVLDGSGQFQPLAPGQIPSHFRCDSAPGQASITVTVDDAAEGTDPVTGNPVPTHNDAPASASDTLQIANHTHQWDGNNLQPGTVNPSQEYPLVGATVGLSFTNGSDYDTCSADDCPFGGMVGNTVVRAQWSGPGQFGYLDLGQFVETTDAALVTCWRAPTTPGDATLTLLWDDIPEAIDPETGQVAATFNDTAVPTSITLHVGAPPPPHEHEWQAVGNIGAGELDAPSSVVGGAVVALAWSGGSDSDVCTAAECPFDGTAYNVVKVTGWSGSGTFGYLDAFGQFQPGGPVGNSTHWKAPTTPGTLTLTATVDDVPSATNPETGDPEATYNDQASTASAAVQVLPPPHEHAWSQVHNIGIQVVAPTGQVAAGARVSVSVTASDTDQCTAASCPFGGTAANTVNLVSWSGGAFGYYDEYSQWVPSSDPQRITHWEAPTTPGSITLTAVVDDQPEATNPQTGQSEATFDDQPADASTTITVSTGASHQHDWSSVHNLPLPLVNVPPNGVGGQVISIAALHPSGNPELPLTDTDQCRNSGCTFPAGVAPNQVRVNNWSDNGAGGMFGYVVGGQFMPTFDPAQITSYLCPEFTGPITLTVTIDDLWQNVTAPGDPLPTNSFDDQPRSASGSVTVASTIHQHQWTHNGNQAWRATDLLRNGVRTLKVYRGEVLEVRLGPYSPDFDVCTAPGCPFPNGRADEVPELHTTPRLIDDIGGTYGKLVQGQFMPLDPTDVGNITHYQVPLYTNSIVLHVQSEVDDPGQAPWTGGLPMNGEPPP